MFDVTLEGVDEFEGRVKRIVAGIAPEKIERALLPVAQHFAAKARAALPKGPTGNLKRGVYAHTPKRFGRLPAASVGISPRIAPHRHIVEFGTTERYAKNGAYRGIMPSGMHFSNAVNRERGTIEREAFDAVKSLVDSEL